MIRPLSPRDAAAVAELHVVSWRSAYRGILRDDYLDGPIEADRARVWKERLSAAPAAWIGVIVERDGHPVGFGFASPGSDTPWGTRIDNLHVRPDARGGGIGRDLVAGLCEAIVARGLAPPLWLWVYEANRAARAFYARIGAAEVERERHTLPGGGEAMAVRCAWPDAAALLENLRTPRT